MAHRVAIVKIAGFKKITVIKNQRIIPEEHGQTGSKGYVIKLATQRIDVREVRRSVDHTVVIKHQ